jgi:type VI protein secretion system component VasF
VASGGRPTLHAEQSKLKGLLGANSGPPWGATNDVQASSSDQSREFLGMRYALTCWLDEVLINAGWREWDENKLEAALYRTNVRYNNFWVQARLAEAAPGAADAQEAFLLCTLLGFRGEMENTPDQLREWVSNTRARVTRSGGKEPTAVPERAAVSDVPELRGAEAYRKMVQRVVAAGLFAAPLLAFLLVVLFR